MTVVQIRRLPAVLYVDSRSERSKDLETLLRDTYGLPLVAFYVDKVSSLKKRSQKRGVTNSAEVCLKMSHHC